MRAQARLDGFKIYILLVFLFIYFLLPFVFVDIIVTCNDGTTFERHRRVLIAETARLILIRSETTEYLGTRVTYKDNTQTSLRTRVVRTILQKKKTVQKMTKKENELRYSRNRPTPASLCGYRIRIYHTGTVVGV